MRFLAWFPVEAKVGCEAQTVNTDPDTATSPAPRLSIENMAYTGVRRLDTSHVMQKIRVDGGPCDIVSQHELEFWMVSKEIVSDPYFARMWLIQEIAASLDVPALKGILHLVGRFHQSSDYPASIGAENFKQIISASTRALSVVRT